MARDEVDLHAFDLDAYAQRAAAHLVDRGAVVVDLDGGEQAGERPHLPDRPERRPRHERDGDPAVVGELRQLRMPAAADGGDEIVERAGVADLLQREHVDLELADHAGERLDLGVVAASVARAALRPRAKQVLHVPGPADHPAGSHLRGPVAGGVLPATHVTARRSWRRNAVVTSGQAGEAPPRVAWAATADGARRPPNPSDPRVQPAHREPVSE